MPLWYFRHCCLAASHHFSGARLFLGFACYGSHTLWMPQEPPRPGPSPASRLHPVTSDPPRTLRPCLLPGPGLFLVILLHLLAGSLHHLQLPGRRRPLPRSPSPPPPPPSPPPAPQRRRTPEFWTTAATSPPSPSTAPAPPSVLAHLPDALARQRRRRHGSATQPVQPTRQWADTSRHGPRWRAECVCHHPEFGKCWGRQQQCPHWGLLCACRLRETDFIAFGGWQEEREKEKWQFR